MPSQLEKDVGAENSQDSQRPQDVGLHLAREQDVDSKDLGSEQRTLRVLRGSWHRYERSKDAIGPPPRL